MKRIRRSVVMVAMLMAALSVIGATVVSAQSSGYSLEWFSIDNGGGQSSGGAYTLNGVIGQADASPLSGDAYILNGGFLQIVDYRIYLPIVLR